MTEENKENKKNQQKEKEKIERSETKEAKFFKKQLAVFLVVCLAGSFVFGLLGGVASRYFIPSSENDVFLKGITTVSNSNESVDQKIIKAVEKSEGAVVSIVATKDVPIVEQYYINPFEDFFGFPFEFQIPQYRQKGTTKKEVSSGSGFIVSPDGYVITNKHVVEDESASYTLFTNDGKKYEVEVIARDPVEDFAVLKIKSDIKTFPFLTLGNSDHLALGQVVIAIGNALGEFRNTVSVGVISGLARSIQASDPITGEAVVLSDVIQTDAAINQGNSGGPLLNLNGEVIGINTAMVYSAQNIGFAIPVDKIKTSFEQAVQTGEIKVPFLGVFYQIVDPSLQEEKGLKVDYGALIAESEEEGLAIIKGSPAEKAGLKEGDIILEVNGQKVDANHDLSSLIRQYKVGDKITLKVLRGNDYLNIEVVLEERKLKQ